MISRNEKIENQPSELFINMINAQAVTNLLNVSLHYPPSKSSQHEIWQVDKISFLSFPNFHLVHKLLQSRMGSSPREQ